MHSYYVLHNLLGVDFEELLYCVHVELMYMCMCSYTRFGCIIYKLVKLNCSMYKLRAGMGKHRQSTDVG